MLFWPPMSQTLSLKPSVCTDLMLKPCVGVMCETSSYASPNEQRNRQVVTKQKRTDMGTQIPLSAEERRARIGIMRALRASGKCAKATHPSELLECSRLSRVVEPKHKDPIFLVILLQSAQQREEALRGKEKGDGGGDASATKSTYALLIATKRSPSRQQLQSPTEIPTGPAWRRQRSPRRS